MEKPQNFLPDCPAMNVPSLDPLGNSLRQSRPTPNASKSDTKPKPPQEVPPPSAPNAPLKSKAEMARERGRSFGAGFATLNGAQMERAENIGDAVRIGMANAARQDDRAALIAQDADSLRELGFAGIDKDDF